MNANIKSINEINLQYTFEEKGLFIFLYLYKEMSGTSNYTPIVEDSSDYLKVLKQRLVYQNVKQIKDSGKGNLKINNSSQHLNASYGFLLCQSNGPISGGPEKILPNNPLISLPDDC